MGGYADELVEVWVDDLDAPRTFALRSDCELIVVDGEWDGPNEWGGSTLRPIHAWVLKSELARCAAEQAERERALSADEIPF